MFVQLEFGVLVGHRAASYYMKNWHTFLLDLCYFINLVLILYLFVFEHNAYLFISLFSISRVVLIGAIFIFRNGIVFHSWDKLASCCIHLMPPLVTYVLRWWLLEFDESPGDQKYHICENQSQLLASSNTGASCDTSIVTLLLFPMAFIALHSLFRVIICKCFLVCTSSGYVMFTIC
jgi:hypothetical protein